jgi:hypothetical protein
MTLRLFWLFAAAACAPALAAGGIKPPPLPPGAAMVRIEAGMSKPERERQIRAHHHKGHVKKDHTRDDSLPDVAPSPPSGPTRPGKR